MPTALILTEGVEISSYDDRLDRDGLGVLHDAEGGPADRDPVAARLDDGIQHEVTRAWGVAVLGVATGRRGEQLGDLLRTRHSLRPGPAERRSRKQRADAVEVARVDQLGVAVQQLGNGQLVFHGAQATCPFTTGNPGSLAASSGDGGAPAAIRCAANEAIIAPLSVHSRGRGIRSVSPLAAQRSSASSRSREFAATPPAISNVDTLRSLAARTALRVSTSATASWNPAATSACGASGWLSTYLATAVLSPEKLNAYGSSRGPVMPRGNTIASRSPWRARSSSTLPPGYPRPSNRATLS